MQVDLQNVYKFQFIALLHAPKKSLSLRASPQTGVAIPFDFRQHSANLMGIATPACALVRDDSLFITVR